MRKTWEAFKNPALNVKLQRAWGKFKKKPRRATPEGIIKLQILRYVRARGYIIGKVNTMGVMRDGTHCFDPYTFRGFPDLVAFIGTKLYFIEVKSKEGVLSAEQGRFQALCEEADIPYIVARSVEDVEKAIGGGEDAIEER